MGDGFKPLYSFTGVPEGENPSAGLVALNGTLFGTTSLGGTSDFGIVYKVTTSGKAQIVHSFLGRPGSDGATPYAGLVAVEGALYGTTYNGGLSGRDYGTVYEVKSGAERVVCSLKGIKGAVNPDAGVVAVNDAFYGTSYYGGTSGDGTVYKCATSGAQQVLHSFKGAADGANPYASLVAFKGELYGTTSEGGTNGDGAVFKITTSGAEKIIHSFDPYIDGANPLSPLTVLDGALYGTTNNGGQNDGGTVYKINPSGTLRVIYAFKGKPDGAFPYGGLIAAGRTLYGTTQGGGKHNDGTVYKMTTSGIEQVLHSFTGVAPDGESPNGGLVLLNGMLYGTTYWGGKGTYGIVYKISP